MAQRDNYDKGEISMARVFASVCVAMSFAFSTQAQTTTAGALMKEGYTFTTPVTGLTVFLLQKGSNAFACRWETLGAGDISEIARKVSAFRCAPIP
jgi:hypothetical protein